mgnify:FL=1
MSPMIFVRSCSFAITALTLNDIDNDSILNYEYSYAACGVTLLPKAQPYLFLRITMPRLIEVGKCPSWRNDKRYVIETKG